MKHPSTNPFGRRAGRWSIALMLGLSLGLSACGDSGSTQVGASATTAAQQDALDRARANTKAMATRTRRARNG